MNEEWVNATFYWCVQLLTDWAKQLGISYEEINIWIFIIIWPLLTLAMAWVIYRQHRRIKHLNGRVLSG